MCEITFSGNYYGKNIMLLLSMLLCCNVVALMCEFIVDFCVDVDGYCLLVGGSLTYIKGRQTLWYNSSF